MSNGEMSNGLSSSVGRSRFLEWWRSVTQSLTLRMALIGFVALVMLIPLAAVHDLVRERNRLHDSALSDIASIWGGEQVVKGPALVVPFVERYLIEETETDEDGNERTRTKTEDCQKIAVFLPKELELEFHLDEEYRHRGIYDALVYASKLRLVGYFERPEIQSLSKDLHSVDWDGAYLAFSLSDTRAIQSASEARVGGEPMAFAPGTRLQELLGSGFHIPLAGFESERAQVPFELDLSFHGSHGLRFAPFGETTEISMASTWPHPSFQGSALPNSYEASDEGFEAKWSIPHLTRNYPQQFIYGDTTVDFDEFLAGVDLFEPVFLNSKVTRAVKYGLLFVLLTYLVFLVFELAAGVRLHVIQYGLIGLAMSLFYLTLLSLAEHVAFGLAYLAATAVNAGMISVYAGATTRSRARAGIVFATLSALYALLFALLHMESYALLLGTLLLTAVVAVLMYLTRDLERQPLAAAT